MLAHCEPECAAQVVGDERILAAAFGDIALVGPKNDYVLEVEVACFEQSHNLQAHNGFAVKGYTQRGHNPQQKAAEARRL